MAGVYIDSQGPFESVPESEADVAALQARLKSGEARTATESETKAFFDARLERQAVAGLKGTAQAAGLGGLRGLTVGLSDPVLGLIPGYAEKARALQEAHPTASIGAEIAGNIAPLILTGGASAAEQGAAKAGGFGLKEAAGAAVKTLGAPVRAIDKIGHAVEGALAVEGAGLANKLVTAAARGAVEGGLYSAGHQISESVLDPNWTAQAARADIGLGALMGGGLGASIGLVTHGATKAVEALQAIRAKWQEAAKVLEGEGIEYLAKKNKMAVQDVERQVQGAHEFGDVLDSPERRTAMAEGRLKAFKAVEGIGDETVKGLSISKEETLRALLNNTADAPGMRQGGILNEAVQKVRNALDDQIARMRADPAVFSGTGLTADTLQAWANKLERATSDRAESYLQTADKVSFETKQAASKLAKDVQSDPHAWAKLGGGEAVVAEVAEPTAGGLSRAKRTVADDFFAIDEVKKELDQHFRRFYSHDPAMRSQAEFVFQRVRGALKETLEDPKYWGEAGAAQAKTNNAIHEFNMKREAAASEFGNKRLSKLGDWEDSGWDAKRMNSLSTQGADLRGEQRQQIARDFFASVKTLLDVAEERQAQFPHLEVTDKELRSIYGKAAKMEETQARFDQYTSLAKPAKMSYGTLGMPGQEGVSLASGVYSTAKAAAIGHIVSGGQALGIPGLGLAMGAVEAAMQARKIVHDVPAATRLLAKLGDTGDRVISKVQGIADKVVSLTPAAARVVGVAAKESTRKETFEARTKKVQAWLENLPEALASANHSAIAEHAPNISASVAGQNATAIQFLAQTMPQPKAFSPLVPARKPGLQEQSRWMSLYDAVDRPLDVLSANPSREQVQAIAFTHPVLMAMVRTQVLTALASAKDATKTSHEARQRAALLLGRDVDGSMASSQINQMLYAGMQTPQENQKVAQQNQQTKTNAAVARMGLARRKDDEEGELK